jgi:chromosome transmission fidelity protein 1
MVGLPYPNLKSPELKEKMDYLNANMVSDVSLWRC